MPGAVARTSTYALNNVTLPHVLSIAEKGWLAALRSDQHLARGLNVFEGEVTNKAVDDSLNLEYVPLEQTL